MGLYAGAVLNLRKSPEVQNSVISPWTCGVIGYVCFVCLVGLLLVRRLSFDPLI